jgi:hypothetical protein
MGLWPAPASVLSNFGGSSKSIIPEGDGALDSSKERTSRVAIQPGLITSPTNYRSDVGEQSLTTSPVISLALAQFTEPNRKTDREFRALSRASPHRQV